MFYIPSNRFLFMTFMRIDKNELLSEKKNKKLLKIDKVLKINDIQYVRFQNIKKLFENHKSFKNKDSEQIIGKIQLELLKEIVQYKIEFKINRKELNLVFECNYNEDLKKLSGEINYIIENIKNEIIQNE